MAQAQTPNAPKKLRFRRCSVDPFLTLLFANASSLRTWSMKFCQHNKTTQIEEKFKFLSVKSDRLCFKSLVSFSLAYFNVVSRPVVYFGYRNCAQHIG